MRGTGGSSVRNLREDPKCRREVRAARPRQEKGRSRPQDYWKDETDVRGESPDGACKRRRNDQAHPRLHEMYSRGKGHESGTTLTRGGYRGPGAGTLKPSFFPSIRLLEDVEEVERVESGKFLIEKVFYLPNLLFHH